MKMSRFFHSNALIHQNDPQIMMKCSLRPTNILHKMNIIITVNNFLIAIIAIIVVIVTLVTIVIIDIYYSFYSYLSVQYPGNEIVYHSDEKKRPAAIIIHKFLYKTGGLLSSKIDNIDANHTQPSNFYVIPRNWTRKMCTFERLDSRDWIWKFNLRNGIGFRLFSHVKTLNM